MKGWICTVRSDRFSWLIIGLTLLHLLPIWAFKYFPSQDGPCHLENSYMLLHYFDSDKPYSHYYNLNLDPVPNWFSHLSLAFLMIFLPPLISEKILLTGYVVFFVCSILYFLKSVGEKNRFFILLAFPFIYNYLLHMGFYNFCFSFPLMFLTIGYWCRRRDLGWKSALGLNLLLIFLYFCHIVSQLLAIGSILFLSLLHHKRRVHKSAFQAILMIPSYPFPVYYILTRGTGHSGRWASDRLWSYFVKIGSLTSYDLREYWVGKALAILFALLIFYTIAWEKIGLRNRFRIELKDEFMLLSLIFFLFYFYMPDGMSRGGFITARLNLYPFISILPWLSPELRKPLKWAIGTAAVMIISVHLGFTLYYYKILNDGLEEYTAGIPLVSENKTILPISFNHGGGESARIGLYLHATGYYCIAKDGVVELDNYEGATGYFPLNYKRVNPYYTIGCIECATGDIHPERYPEPIDYILLWCPKEEFPAKGWIEENYELILSRGRLRLYKRRSPS